MAIRLNTHQLAATCLLATLLLSPGAAAQPGTSAPVYAPVSAQPTYSEATALAYQHFDHKISYGNGPSQYGLLWLPKNEPTGKKPMVVVIHGGCWLEAYDISHTYPLATALAHEGYPVWNLEYRRTGAGGGSWPDSYEDIQAGLQKISSLSEFGLVPREVVLVGHSAGGHLALLAAADWPKLFPEGIPHASAIGMAAITDVEHYARGENSCQQATTRFMGGTPDTRPDAYAAANPNSHTISIPVALLHGDQDPIVPLSQLELFSGTYIQKQVVRGAAHFDWIHPGTPAFQTLLRQLETGTSGKG